MKHFYLITLCLAATVLGGCTTVSKVTNKLSNKEWQEIGYNDGFQGKYARTSQKLKQQPRSKEAISAYQTGWDSGAATYCTPNNAYEIGRRGETYNKICPAALAKIFELSYQRGKQSFCKNEKSSTEKQVSAVCQRSDEEKTGELTLEAKPT